MTKAKGKGPKFVPAADKSGWKTPADEPVVLRGKRSARAREAERNAMGARGGRGTAPGPVGSARSFESAAAPTSPVSRTRAVGTPPPAERVAKIAEMMRACEWVRGESAEGLAKEWGLGTNTVEHDAAEASRRVLAEVKDPELIARTVGTALQEGIRRAMVVSDLKSLPKLAEVWGKLGGLMVQKTELSGPGGKPVEVAAVDLTEQQAEDEILRLAEEIRKRRGLT